MLRGVLKKLCKKGRKGVDSCRKKGSFRPAAPPGGHAGDANVDRGHRSMLHGNGSLGAGSTVGFFISAGEVLLHCGPAHAGWIHDEVGSRPGCWWSGLPSGVFRMEEERLNCALCAGFRTGAQSREGKGLRPDFLPLVNLVNVIYVL